MSNAGTISGGTAALQFVGAADTLTLLAGSRIVGAINLGGGGDTVNFRGGNHNLTFDTLAGATVTGTTPFVVSGNRAVAVDPTPFAMADRNLMDFSRTISAVIPDIGTVGTGGGAPPLAFAVRAEARPMSSATPSRRRSPASPPMPPRPRCSTARLRSMPAAPRCGRAASPAGACRTLTAFCCAP